MQLSENECVMGMVWYMKERIFSQPLGQHSIEWEIHHEQDVCV